MQHHHFLLTFGGQQYFAPGADSAKRVLDVGTGTGAWAIDFGRPLTLEISFCRSITLLTLLEADEHPDAEV